jgi:hypothetical protein
MTILALTLAVLATIGFSILGVLVVRRFITPHIGAGHNDVVVPIFLTAGTIYAVLLAFLVVAVWESYDAAHANASEEASTLTTLYRASEGMEPAAGQQMRQIVRRYTDAVIGDEWTLQADAGQASPKARAAVLEMYRFFGRQPQEAREHDAGIDQAALQLIDQIMNDRNKRTLQAGDSLPGIMWLGAIGSGALVLFLSFFLHMERAWPQAFVISVMAVMMAILLCITSILSRPFSGPMALEPEGFRHALQVYAAIDRTP